MINYEIIISIVRHTHTLYIHTFPKVFPPIHFQMKIIYHNLEYLTDAYFSLRPIKRMDVLVKNEHKKFKNYKTSSYI